MRKLLAAIVALCAIYGGISETQAVKRFTTYTPLRNCYGNYNTNYPQVIKRYDTNGRTIGTYINNANYANFNNPNYKYIIPNKVMNRTYYYNNNYNPAMYRYNGALGGLKSYNRFGQRIR